MNVPAKKPYSREEFAGALAANAAAKPFNVALLVGTMTAGVVVGAQVGLALLAALVVYGIAAAWTFFDDEEAEAVLARERDEHRKQLEQGTRRVDPRTLAPDIREHLLAL